VWYVTWNPVKNLNLEFSIVDALTSTRDFAGWVSWQVVVAVGSRYRLFRPWCLSDTNFSGTNYFRGGWRPPMAQAGPLEGVYLSMVSPTWLVTDEDEFGCSGHPFSRSCPVRDILWWCWVSPTFVPLLRHLRFSMTTSSSLDWFFDGGCTQHLRSFCSVHLFSRRPQGPTVIFTACEACLCLGCVDREKPSRFQPFRDLCVSAIGQSQDVCIPVVEGD
jgi:hypothetical protein